MNWFGIPKRIFEGLEMQELAKPTIKLDSYYEWCVEKARHRLKEAQGTGGELSILMAVLDSVLVQVNVEVVEYPGCSYRELTKALKEKSENE
jgi:hypothetical protein